MSSYRSAYEEYYKNINNLEKGKSSKKKYSILDKKSGDFPSSRFGLSLKSNDKFADIIAKRLIKELTGATILLVFFTGLKYIPTDQAKEMHLKCKEALNYNINYNDCINTINTIQTSNDFKIENLRTQAYKFVEYIRSNSNLQN